MAASHGSSAIADPRGTHDPFATLHITDGTFSTSGDYERFFMKDGVRYHHLLDPDFGEPARGCRSVTIVANRAVMADVLSTGVFIMGPDEGMKLIEQLPDVEGVIVTADNEVLVSSGLKGRRRDYAAADRRTLGPTRCAIPTACTSRRAHSRREQPYTAPRDVPDRT